MVLFAGTRVGSPGTFVALRTDSSWGDIRDSKGNVAAHPMQWVRHWREGAELPTTVAAMTL